MRPFTTFLSISLQELPLPVPGFDTDLVWQFVEWIVLWLNDWIQLLFAAGFGLMVLGWLLNTRR